MDDCFFDILYEGTTLEDCVNITNIETNSMLVFDDKKEYGTTFSNLEEFAKYRFIENVEINKNESEIQIEAQPLFIKATDSIFKIAQKCGVTGFCDFVKIKNHFVKEKNFNYKIPYTLSDLITSSFLSLKDKNLLNKIFNKKEKISENLVFSDLAKTILSNLYGNSNSLIDSLQELVNHFGNTPFYYPVYGIKDIVELLSRSNAMNGVSYLLDRSLEVYQIQSDISLESVECEEVIHGIAHNRQNLPTVSNVESYSYKLHLLSSGKQTNPINIKKDTFKENFLKGYKYLIVSEHGNIFGKQLYFKEKTGKKQSIRLLNIKKSIPVSYTWMKYNGIGVNILSLDSTSKCCQDDTSILYLLSDHKLKNEILHEISLCEDDVLSNISYEFCEWNIKQL